MTKIYADIYPYFKKVANHYWDDLYKSNISVWDWLGREYDIIKIGHLGNKPELWVSFPDEKMIAWFMLRWV